MKVKIIGLLVAVVLVAAMVAVAARATSAYFSDTHNGEITGTIGEISVNDLGGTVGRATASTSSGTRCSPASCTRRPISVQNTSSSNSEDLWIHFDNLTALSALNQLGQLRGRHDRRRRDDPSSRATTSTTTQSAAIRSATAVHCRSG